MAIDIFLYSVPSDANANDIRLRDPTTVGAAGAISATASQVISNFTQTATSIVALSAVSSQIVSDFSVSATAQTIVSANASQIVGDFTQLANAQNNVPAGSVFVPIASGGWGDGGSRGITAIYGPANRAQKRTLKRLIDEATDEELPRPLIDAAKAAQTRTEIASAIILLRAELAQIADDDDDDDDYLLMAA